MKIPWSRSTVQGLVALLAGIALIATSVFLLRDPGPPTALAAAGAGDASARTSPERDPSAGDRPTATTPTQPRPRVAPASGTTHPRPPALRRPPARADHDHDHEQDADEALYETAERFLADVVGMTDPVRGIIERNGECADVLFHGRGEDGRTLTGVMTAVSLRRSGDGWTVTGAQAPNIDVDTPTRGQTVSSPVTVTGRAHAYEGTVNIRVVEDRGGSHTEVGTGFVTGAGDHMGTFSGEIPFVQHNSERGWVVFTEYSAVDGSAGPTTAVRVAFADDVAPDPGEPGQEEPAEPTIDEVTLDPTVPLEAGWLMLPPGPGTLTVVVRATSAERVDLVLTPTGTETAPYAETVATSAGHDGTFTLVWPYGDDVLHHHLGVVAVGPGGRAEADLPNVYRD